MSDQPTFTAGPELTTGRFLVTFREDSVAEGLTQLKKGCGISKLPNAADFEDSAFDTSRLAEEGGVFPTLGVAVVSMEDDGLTTLLALQGDDSAILAIEPEPWFYALGDGMLPFAYLQGYRDAVNNLYEKAIAGTFEAEQFGPQVTYLDDAQSTWGLKATRVVTSRYTGRGIKVAVLDTGMDLLHPDFRGRSITSKSFVNGQSVQDGHGHGTHCIGTSCGFRDVNGRRYGVAREAAIFAGKVLDNGGSGAGAGIIAGMEWAVTNGCQVISMSLGNTNPNPSTAYDTIGQRALQLGSLVVAAAGNHGPGTVGQPANSASIMAVAALDSRLRTASFSSPSGSAPGASVDIAGPGVNVYSSWPMSTRYRTISGTSMATPHVAGIAALCAEAYRARGLQLWQLLSSRAQRLPQSSREVGAGLVLAPQ